MSSQTTYQGGRTLEGLGGPVNVDPYSFEGIDPTLDSCCQREVGYDMMLVCLFALFACLRFHVVVVLWRVSCRAVYLLWGRICTCSCGYYWHTELTSTHLNCLSVPLTFYEW